MTTAFTLTEEPWVVCLGLDGSEQTLGLRDALVRAHELAEIQGEPPVAAALLRLLVAIVHRVLDGPKTIDDWATAWKRGCFPAPAVDTYLDCWQDRFDLFSPEVPFFQSLLPDTARKPPTHLDPAAARGHNATLFDHSRDGASVPISAAAAARALVALQAFTSGGLLPGENGGKLSGKAGLLSGAWVYFVTGPTLFHTLLLNTPLYDPATERPFACQGKDEPVWERPVVASAQTRSPAGWLDLLTYPSRRVQLVAEADHSTGEIMVSAVAVTDGDRADGCWSRGRDQNLAFRETDKGWIACKPSEARDLWRDADVLLRAQPDAHERPRIIEHVGRLVHAEAIPQELRLGLDAYALATNQAKYVYWRHQRLPLRSEIFDVGDRAEAIADALTGAEDVAAELSRGVAKLAGRPLLADDDRGEDARRRRTCVARSMAAYWGHLGPEFNRFLAELDDTGSALRQWSESVELTVRKVWQEWSASVADSAEGFRREADADRHYWAAIAQARSLREGDI
ncbi:MAG: type I-E CRISPR-associated protein Cse1/CasA [Acidimicrobiales bacterium]